MDGLIREIPTNGKIFVGDLNGHVGMDNRWYERVHRGQGFGERIELGDIILEFSLEFD